MHIVRRGIPATSLLLAFKLLLATKLLLTTSSAQIIAQKSFSPKTFPAYSANPTAPAGAYWRLQQPDQPPLPYNPFPDLPVYTLDPTNHVYLIDDSSVDYPEFNESRAMESSLARFVGDFEFQSTQAGEGQSSMFSLMHSSDELWLEITGVTPSERTGYFVV